MAQRFPVHGVGQTRRGFTFIEMMVVIVIVGILSALAYSGWTKVMWLVQAKGSADQFRNAILLARSDAMVRRHNSGLYLDSANHRFLRFVDSSVVGGVEVHDGTYAIGEKVLQSWDTLPKNVVIYKIESSSTTDPTPSICNAATSTTTITYGTSFPVVFRPDGRPLGPFKVVLGARNFPKDTFTLDVLPATGLVTMEH